jgi:hypothetical protein
LTLHNWSRLATPHLGGVLEERVGVAIKVRLIAFYKCTVPVADEGFCSYDARFQQISI